MSKQLFNSRGAPISLGKEIGKGGEGAVSEIIGHPDKVAKINFKPLSRDHAQKLTAMTSLTTPELLRIAAMPLDTLHDHSRQVVGFIMPKVLGHEPVFKVYGPKLRLREFPKADWRFLIHAAANTARAFSTVHAASLVVGDVNHGNLVVSQDATVRMIDCDSFQVSSGNSIWFCEVGVGTHQPPEMQGLASYKTVRRSTNHDNFGLAVIIFQLLCIGKHPFAGRPSGSEDIPTLEDAIAASRYAHSIEGARTRLKPPLGSLPVDALGPELQGMFEKAFSPSGRNGSRPTATEWVTALDSLQSEVRPCASNQSHFYRKGYAGCPWCQIESSTNTTLFPVIFTPGSSGTTSIAAIWQQIESVPSPPAIGPVPTIPAPSRNASDAAKAINRKEVSLLLLSWLTVAAGVAMTFAGNATARAVLIFCLICALGVIQGKAKKTKAGPFQQALFDVQAEWSTLCEAWRQAVESQGFTCIKQTCVSLKSEYDGLSNERLRRLQVLHDKRRDKQLEEHLDRFTIAQAGIAGIKHAKIATLTSYGIDTAFDVNVPRIMALPGFGPHLTQRLYDWRQSHERTFRFDGSRGVAAADVANVERDIMANRSRIESLLSANVSRLRNTSFLQSASNHTLIKTRTELESKIPQARADALIARGNTPTSKRRMAAAAVLFVVAGLSALDTGSSNAVAQSSGSDPSSGQVSQQAPAQHTADTSTSTVAGNQKIIMTHAANVRSGPSTSSSVVQVANAGAVFQVFQKSQGWVQVGDASPVGWVYSAFVRVLP
ncbi:SH3 domain-containing protein [Acidisoma cellulosilytica]|uniref:SH3 domain-containing protein n=1 Tax=Acidisoma cellulosilyticum TaxID=2802395 RepID=A0A963Z8I7_9PROT|nr:SH3 domain-containing protein [Acidisoma cellulosilyticum]MCB8883827.1 SH3 domain-containing protein [Acidisoma cellulosilyticum]